MLITKQTVADKIAAYLHHDITMAQLVNWAENAMMEADWDETNATVLTTVIGRLGLADVRAFGLTWEECEQLLKQLGFAARVEIVAG